MRLPCFKKKKDTDSTTPFRLGSQPIMTILTLQTQLLCVLIAQVEPCWQVQDNLMKPVSCCALMETQDLSYSWQHG